MAAAKKPAKKQIAVVNKGESAQAAVKRAQDEGQMVSAYPLTRKRQMMPLNRGPMDLEGGRQLDPMGEIGTSGLKQYGGFVLEEWLTQLQGRRAAWAYREMLDNDATIGAILFAIEMLARALVYRVQDGDAERAEFVESCMHDMSHSWIEFIIEALTCLPYGWAFHEEVLKLRRGPRDDTLLPMTPQDQLNAVARDTEEDTAWQQASSEFKDGKIGWRKLPLRKQESLLRWHFDGYSGLRAMEQIDWHGGDHIIPIQKALLFRTRTVGKNPEGRSILRNAWTAFFKKTNIEQIEAIGIERDLAGIPVVTPPDGVDLYNPAYTEVRERVEELVQAVKKDEDQGIILPSAGWQFELVSSGGARQVNTNEVITRYDQRIASSILADFILLGQAQMGSFAMTDIKMDLFGIAVDAIVGDILAVMNKYAIPRLLKRNGMKTENPPRITASSAGRIDLEKVGRFLQSVALAGGPIPWSKELMEELFREAGLPAVFPGGALETPGHPTGAVNPLGAGPGTQQRPGLAAGSSRPALEQQNGVRATGPRNDERAKHLSKAEMHGGAMVALYPNKKTRDALAPHAEIDPSELHLTLAYMGKAKDLEDPDKLREVVKGFAASCPPLDGEVSGHGHFENTQDGPVTVALVSSEHLQKKQGRLHSMLTNAGMEPPTKYGFIPHMTLAHAKIHPGEIARPVKFKKVSLVIAGKREDFPLTGDPAALST